MMLLKPVFGSQTVPKQPTYRLVPASPQDVAELGKAVAAIAEEQAEKTPDANVSWLDKRLNALVKGLRRPSASSAEPSTVAQKDGYRQETPGNHWLTQWVAKHRDAAGSTQTASAKNAMDKQGVITSSVIEHNGRKKLLVALAKPFAADTFQPVKEALASLLATTALEDQLKDVIVVAGNGDPALKQWLNRVISQKGMHDHQFGQTARDGAPDNWRNLVGAFDPAGKHTLYMFHANALLKPLEGLQLDAKEKHNLIQKKLASL